MPSDSMPGFWKQRKQALLDFQHLKNITIQADLPPYLKPLQAEKEGYSTFWGNNTNLEGGDYSFEEAFWFVPDLLEFVEYEIDAESGEVNILQQLPFTPQKTGADQINFIFERVLLNLVPNTQRAFAPTTEHPCTTDTDAPDAAAMTAGSNCPTPLMMPDDHFMLFYLKDEEKVYRTDASLEYEIMFNNYLIPTLSADMSIWWYKIPNRFLDSDQCAKETAEEALTIWHKDRKTYLASLNPDTIATQYVGVYQRSYFCDELQMRFTNLARIGNDGSILLEYDIHEFTGITYQPLKAV